MVQLWKIPVPSKIKVFLWRLAQCSLPTADVVKHRNMRSSPCCAICGVTDSWFYSLINCTMARCVWALNEPELVEHLLATAEPDVKAWIFSIISSVSHAEVIRIVITLWAIWSAQRKLIREGEHQSPLSTHMFINRYISDLQVAMPTHAISNTCPPQARAKAWNPTPSGCTKVNVDGAVCGNPPIGAISAVCRDEHGA